MSKLSLWYPVKPLHVNQGFGSGADYYSKFHDTLGNPLKGHNGNDLMAAHGQPVYAAIDGIAQDVKDAHGGEGVIITTTEPYEYAGGTCWFNVINWHLIGDTDAAYSLPIPYIGRTSVKVGDLIGFADNTGAPYESSGDHLHFGVIPVDQNQKQVFPGNGYNGAIDATPYFNGYFAQDSQQVLGIMGKIIQLLKTALAAVKKN